MAKNKTLVTKEDMRQAALQQMYSSTGWKIYEEEVIQAKLDSVNDQFDKLTAVGLSANDLGRLNSLIEQRAFLKSLIALGEPLKEDANERQGQTV